MTADQETPPTPEAETPKPTRAEVKAVEKETERVQAEMSDEQVSELTTVHTTE